MSKKKDSTSPLTFAKITSLSGFNHPLYKIVEMSSGYHGWEERVSSGTTYDPDPGAEIISSQVVNSQNLHTVMLDIDMPVSVVPSTTPGHYHLYIDRPMEWKKYKKLLKALAKAGIIEKRYYWMSVRRKHTALRLPHVKKR